MTSIFKKNFADQRLFREINLGDRVMLNTENEVVLNLIVEDIYDNNSLLLQKPRDAAIFDKISYDVLDAKNLVQRTLVLSSYLKVDGGRFAVNDKVKLKFENGKTAEGIVLYIIDKSALVIGPKNLKNKHKILKKLIKM